MRRMKCPRCQSINYEEHITYPICHNCHENLLQCRYCLNFPGEELRCPHLPEWSMSGGNQVVECEQRDSSLHVGGSRSEDAPRPLRAALVASIVVCSIIIVMVAAIPMLRGPLEHEPNLIVIASVPSQTVLGESMSMSFVVFNDDPLVAEDLRIRVDEQVFRYFRIESIVPYPTRVVINPVAKYYVYEGLQPKERVNLSFNLRSYREGSVPFEVNLYSAEGKHIKTHAEDVTVQPIPQPDSMRSKGNSAEERSSDGV